MSTMNRLVLLFQVGSVLVAYLLSRLIVGAIISRMSRGAEQGPSFFAMPRGSALLSGVLPVQNGFRTRSEALALALYVNPFAKTGVNA